MEEVVGMVFVLVLMAMLENTAKRPVLTLFCGQHMGWDVAIMTSGCVKMEIPNQEKQVCWAPRTTIPKITAAPAETMVVSQSQFQSKEHLPSLITISTIVQISLTETGTHFISPPIRMCLLLGSN